MIPDSTLNKWCDDILPSSGTDGYLVLLDDLTGSATLSAINTSTDVITTSAAHGFATGTRIRFALGVGAVIPAATPTLNTTTDYYFRSLSSTTGALYETLADAEADTGRIDFSDAGSGTITLNEQELSGGTVGDTVIDAIAVLVNHEIDHPDYSRFAVTDLSTASGGLKPVYDVNQSVNSPNGDLTVRSVIYLQGGTSTPGDDTGDLAGFYTLAPVTITEGNSKTINVTIGLRNRTT